MLSGFEYKTTAKLSEKKKRKKKHVPEVSRFEVLGRKVSKKKKSQLERVKRGQIEVIPIGFESDRLAALCKKNGSESCWEIAKQCQADCSNQLGSSRAARRRFLHSSVPEFLDTEQVQPRRPHTLLIPPKRCSVSMVLVEIYAALAHLFLFGCSKYSDHCKHEFHLLFAA